MSDVPEIKGDTFHFKHAVGIGGNADVYETVRESVAPGGGTTSERAAVKVWHDNYLPRSRGDIAHEASVTAGIDHPNVPKVAGVASFGGRTGLVSEFVDGAPLNEVLTDQALSPKATAELVSGVADALDAAHNADRPVIHGDIKPSNIMVTNEGDVRVVDWGVAEERGPAPRRDDEGLAGTARFMAPERGRIRGDPASDVFALGAVAHEAVTGGVRLLSNRRGEQFQHSGEGVWQQHLDTRFAEHPKDWRDSEAQAMMRRMLDQRPDQRPDAATISREMANLSTVLPGPSLKEQMANHQPYTPTTSTQTGLSGRSFVAGGPELQPNGEPMPDPPAPARVVEPHFGTTRPPRQVPDRLERSTDGSTAPTGSTLDPKSRLRPGRASDQDPSSGGEDVDP